jgi:aminomethyltransferase
MDISLMLKTTPLFNEHQKLHPQWVDFCGWNMPLHYGSQIEEHCAVRSHAGIFDVSHMGIVDILGKDAKHLLRYALANDVEKLTAGGQALYSCMLKESGGILDDLIVYYFNPEYYRIIWNASRRDNNFKWLSQIVKNKKFEVTLKERVDLGMIAIQGPDSIPIASNIFSENIVQIQDLPPFHFFCNGDVCFARTGYTGERGLEIIAPHKDLMDFWQKFIDAAVQPCGLGARNTLRLEAGFNLYGNDMTEATSPLVSNLSWTIDWTDPHRDFIGKKSLLKEKEAGIKTRLVGVLLKEKGMLRPGQKIMIQNDGEGVITSTGYSPILNTVIGLARIPNIQAKHATVEYRKHRLNVDIVKPIFVRAGKSMLP